MSFDAGQILDGLKPFQRATVEYVFDRFYSSDDPVSRFLVADEVGLGKTMVARGVIAKLIEHLMEEAGRRIDIVYICSNQAIAQQNFSKLAVVGRERRAVTDRITTLPLHIRGLEEEIPEYGRGINIVPITPTTSLDLRSSVGRADERALLWWLLTDERLIGRREMRRVGGRRLFMPPISTLDSFERRIDEICPDAIDAQLWNGFADAIAGSDIVTQVGGLISDFCSESRVWQEPWRSQRISVVAELRRRLADVCIAALEPDLVVLDEFQRFPRIFDAGSPTGELARKLFDYPGCKSLLLSATPYRMFSRSQELDDDHYRDFLATTRFLIDDDCRSEQLEQRIARYRGALRQAVESAATAEIGAARDAVRDDLLRVMCRTERLDAAGDRNGMLDARPPDGLAPKLAAADLRGYADLERVAASLQARDVVEFWKSAPYALNLMDDYALTRAFEDRVTTDPIPISCRIDADVMTAYGDVDPGNARLRCLIDRLDEEGAWKCLWLPPSLPYYAAGPPFDRVSLATKRLIFSKWKVVPKAIAALTSFHMDRRIYGQLDGIEVENTAEGRKAVGGPLAWSGDRRTELLLVAPGREIAAMTDPLMLAGDLMAAADGALPGAAEQPMPSRADVLDAAEKRTAAALRSLQLPMRGGKADPRWYLVASLRLDEAAEPGSVAEWLRHDAFGPASEHRVWAANVDLLLSALESDDGLGAVPKDLARVLAHVGVGSPGSCALRALRRSFETTSSRLLARRALAIANAIRLMLNLPESVAIVRSMPVGRSRLGRRGRDTHWRATLDYAVAGNLQAVLDEYVHALRDWAGGSDEDGRLEAVIGTAIEAIGIGAASLRGRHITADGRIDGERPLAFHSRFAVRLGDGQGEDEKSVHRVDSLRKAFNSPFWPFVLATTSIGQEGLDFHLYSHAVVHWNLPHNPVDLEQREGRVHRFKNHAVRRNVAAAHRTDAFAASGGDPWRAMFAAAEESTTHHDAAGGLRPYWVFPGPALIERHVPAEPLSIDRHRLAELVTLMGIYRLAFGQPRQDELLAALRALGTDSSHAENLIIDLGPPGSPPVDALELDG